MRGVRAGHLDSPARSESVASGWALPRDQRIAQRRLTLARIHLAACRSYTPVTGALTDGQTTQEEQVMVSSTDTDVLLVSAISVWNRALDTHRGSFPFREILARLDALPEDRCAGIEVYEDDPARPIARFKVCFRKGLIEPAAPEPLAEDVCWRVRAGDLERVVAHAGACVRDPARLEWGWVQEWAYIDS